MAKKQNRTQPVAQAQEGRSKADIVKAYKAEHSEATPSEISAALKAQGTEITPAHVSTILSRKGGSGRGVDAFRSQIKLAAAFVKANGGKVEKAIAAIEQVGGFIDECGSSADAKSALEAYQDLASSL